MKSNTHLTLDGGCFGAFHPHRDVIDVFTMPLQKKRRVDRFGSRVNPLGVPPMVNCSRGAAA